MVDFLGQKFLTDGMSASIASLSAEQYVAPLTLKTKSNHLKKSLSRFWVLQPNL